MQCFAICFVLLLLGCTSMNPIKLSSETKNTDSVPNLPTHTPTFTTTPQPFVVTPSKMATALAKTPEECNQIGEIIASEAPSPVLSEPIIYHIYLPPCYEPDPMKRYPLIILLHGQTGDNQMWINMGLTDKADDLIMKDEIPPFIIVFPLEKKYLIDSRESDYDQALIEDFLPYLMQNYAISDKREDHAIGGISRGANWAVQIGMSNPELFASVGAHSFPSFGNEVLRLPARIEKIGQIGGLRMYFDIGEKDPYKKYWDDFLIVLKKYDFPFESHIYPGEHNTDYWKSHLEEYLRWYSDAW